MRLIPHEEFNIKTPKHKDEVILRLRSNTEPGKIKDSIFGYRKSNKLFSGVIYDDSYIITPVIHSRNSFIPVIRGRISECEEGADISANMKLSAFVSVFMVIWLSMCALSFIFFVINVISTRVFNSVVFIPLLMTAFGFCLMNISFRYNVKEYISKLSNLVGGEYQTSRQINKGNRKA